MAESASMGAEGKEAMQSAMKRAQEAMQAAQEQLQEGKSASAAKSQREALSQLDQAQKAAQNGVSPQSAEDRAEAQRLAQEQARIEKEILDLAKRIEDRENASPTPNMQRAQEAAQAARGDRRRPQQGL